MMKIIRTVGYIPYGTSANCNSHRTYRFDHLVASQQNLCSSLSACESTLWISSVQVNKLGILLEFTFVWDLKGENIAEITFLNTDHFLLLFPSTLAFYSFTLDFWERLGKGKTRERQKVMNKKEKGRKYRKNMLETHPSTDLCARKIKRN